MEFLTTEKGTKLPLLDLKGKKYLQVNWRVLWYREVHPLGRIDTERISESQDHVTYRATVSVPFGGSEVYIKLSNADKTVQIKSTLDYEKCETSAIGRALSLAGFGTTQGELDEGDSISDAPLDKQPPPKFNDEEQLPDFQFEMLSRQAFPEKSKFPSKTFEDVVTNSPVAAQNYYQWILRQEREDWSKLAEFQRNFKKFYEAVHEGE